MASYLINPTQFLLDANGKPIRQGKMYVYLAGTSTLADLFSDSGLTNAATNPVPSDASGRYTSPFLNDGEYDIVIKDENDTALAYPAVSNFPTFIASSGGAVPITNGGTGSTTAAAARTALGAASAADVSTLSSEVSDVSDIIAAVPGGVLGDVAALDAVSPTDLATGFSDVCIKQDSISSSSVVTVSTLVNSATQPTNVNGTELLSLAFAPTRTDSDLEFWATIHIKGNNIGQGLFYLCRGDSANAIALSFIRTDSSNVYSSVEIYHRFSPGATTSITYSIRAANADSGDSFTMNTSDFGGTAESSLRIKELIDTPIS